MWAFTSVGFHTITCMAAPTRVRGTLGDPGARFLEYAAPPPPNSANSYLLTQPNHGGRTGCRLLSGSTADSSPDTGFNCASRCVIVGGKHRTGGDRRWRMTGGSLDSKAERALGLQRFPDHSDPVSPPGGRHRNAGRAMAVCVSTGSIRPIMNWASVWIVASMAAIG